MTVSLRQYAELLAGYLRPEWRKASLLAVLLLGSIGLQLLNPQILRQFIDAVASGRTTDALAGAAVLFIVVALSQQTLAIASAYVGEDVGWRTTNRLRSDLAIHCLRLDMSFHNRRTPGEMIERIDGDVTALANFFSQFVIRIVGSGILLIGVLVLLFREDWRVGVAIGSFAVVAVWLLNRCRDLAVPATAAEREASARLFGYVEERLAGLDDIRSSSAGAHVMRGFFVAMRELFLLSRRSWLMRSTFEGLSYGLFAVAYVLATSLGAYLYFGGAVTLGTVFLVFQYTEMLRSPVEQLTREMQELQKAGAGITRVRELFGLGSALPEGTGALPPAGALTVELENVTFGYGSDVPVLRDVSLRLAPGRMLGLLGRTGSGKTTIARLLFRLYDPAAGAVRVGGVDLRDLQLDQLRRRIAMVTQDVQLFQASIRDNLTFFDPGIEDARLRDVLARLGLGEWLGALPDGLDTELGPGGEGLSAGESQLLAVARAFLRDPGLVILDEPSSRLDPATERRIERAMAALVEGRTAIVIAHRLGTVERADEILVLEDGRVQEHGDRARLVADSRSRFAQLLRAGLEEVLV